MENRAGEEKGANMPADIVLILPTAWYLFSLFVISYY